MAAQVTSHKSQRFGSIDAVRGAAILFVFLSHFTGTFTWSAGSAEISGFLRTISMIASPTFVTVSGMVAGFLFVTRPEKFGDLRNKLIDRGVFLLVIGHLALVLTQGGRVANFGHAYRTSYITDAIAIAIIIGPTLVGSLPGFTRVGLAASVFIIDWMLIKSWHPTASGEIVKMYFVGMTGPSELSAFAVFPVLPWLAVYLVGTAIGEQVGEMYERGQAKASHYLVGRIGLGSFLVGAAIHGAGIALRHAPTATNQWDVSSLTLLSIYGKFPPGIVYLAFFGGAGLVMLAAIFEFDRRVKSSFILDEVRRLGRSSLFIFIVQYALYRTLLPKLGLPYTPLWPVIFLVSVAALAQLAVVWDRNSANRFLTVGLASLLPPDDWGLLRHREPHAPGWRATPVAATPNET